MLTGIIGKTNTGKSTFFNAATLLNVPMANYPFTTISPNFGIGYLRVKCVCKKLGVKDNPINSLCVDGARLIPVGLVDVAGLVPGASTGKGLGNKFLDDIRQADALIQVVDASGCTDMEGKPCSLGTHDPLQDVEFVEKEFDIWLKQIVTRDWPRIARSAESGSGRLVAMLVEKLSGLSIRESQIIQAVQDVRLKPDKPTSWVEDDLMSLCTSLRKRAKPSLIVANRADLPTAEENIWKLKKTDRLVVPCAAEAELLLRKASEKNLIEYLPGDSSFKILDGLRLTMEQRRALEFVEERVLKIWNSTGVQQAINSAYLDLLDSIIVYPVEDESKISDKKGNVLPDARILRRGSTAKDLAYAIHTDLGESFLYAVNVKNGKRLGSEYILQDLDVIKIVATAKRG